MKGVVGVGAGLDAITLVWRSVVWCCGLFDLPLMYPSFVFLNRTHSLKSSLCPSRFCHGVLYRSNGKQALFSVPPPHAPHAAFLRNDVILQQLAAEEVSTPVRGARAGGAGVDSSGSAAGTSKVGGGARGKHHHHQQQQHEGTARRRAPKADAARTSNKFIGQGDAEGGACWEEEFFFARVSGETAVYIVCVDKVGRVGLGWGLGSVFGYSWFS